MATEEPKAEATYEAGCHCGYISLSVTLSPPLPEHEVLHCNCSICRRGGYLLVRQFNDVDLDSLKYKKFDGIHKMVPAGDLSGVEINAETGEPTSSGSQK
ncbi:hypothetical protein Neosp_008217 [[Neocosmospora] mangrovei]